ncbi:hypothetical protein ABPG72_003492 [Tetrahymena utriculariae]
MQNSVLQIMKNLSDADSPYLLSKVQIAEEKGYIKKPVLLLIQHFHQSLKAQANHEEEDDNLKFENKCNSKSFKKLIQKLEIKETAMSIDQYYSRYLSLIQNNQSYKSDFEQYLNETIRKKQKRIDEEVIGRNGKKQSLNQQKEKNSFCDVEINQQALKTYIQQQDINTQRDQEMIQKAIQNLNQSQSIQSTPQTQSQNDRKDSQILKGQDYQQKKQTQIMESLSQQTQENSHSLQIDAKNINQDNQLVYGGKQMTKGNSKPFKIKKQRDEKKKSNQNQMIISTEQKEADSIHKETEANNQQNYKIIDKNPKKIANQQMFNHNMQNSENQVVIQNQNEFSQEYYQRSYYDNYYQRYPQYQMGQQDFSQLQFDPQSLPQDLQQEMLICENLQKKLIDDIMNKKYCSDGLTMDEKISKYLQRKHQLDEKLKLFSQRQSHPEQEIQKMQNHNQEYVQQKNKEDTELQSIREDSNELKQQKALVNNYALGNNSKQADNSKQFLGINEKRKDITAVQPQKSQKGNLSQQQRLSKLHNERNSLDDSYQQQYFQKINYSQNEQIYSDSSNKEAKTSSQKNENITKEKAGQKLNGKNDLSQQNKISNENYNQIKNSLTKSFQDIDKQRQITNLGYQNQPNQMQYNKYPPFKYEQQQQYAHNYYSQHPNHQHPPPPPYTHQCEKYSYSQAAYQLPPNQIPQPPLNSQSQIKLQKQQPPSFIVSPQQQVPLHETSYRSNMYPPQVGQSIPSYQHNDFQNNSTNLQNYSKQKQIQSQYFHQQPSPDNHNIQQKKLLNGQGSLSSKESIQLKNLSDINKQMKHSQIEEISSESDVQLIENHQKLIQEIKN